MQMKWGCGVGIERGRDGGVLRAQEGQIEGVCTEWACVEIEWEK